LRDINDINGLKDWIADNDTLSIIRNKYESSKDKERKDGSDIKRNFFAHSGLESTFVKIRKEDGRIIITYDTDRIDEIKNGY